MRLIALMMIAGLNLPPLPPDMTGLEFKLPHGELKPYAPKPTRWRTDGRWSCQMTMDWCQKTA